MRERILICGASGFIGRNLFESLSKNPNLDVYGTFFRNNFIPSQLWNLWHIDLEDKASVNTLLSEGFDVVIQAAAKTDGSLMYRLSPEKYVMANTTINQNILEAVNEFKIPKFIFLSCSVMYPSRPWAQKEHEATDVHNAHPAYFLGAAMKMYVENLCKHYSRKGNTNFTIIRHSNCYGPHDKFNAKGHVLSATIDKVMRSDNEITVWGDGNESRDFLHISDLARFIDMAIQKRDSAFDVVNLGGGELISIRDLVKKIITLSGKRISANYDADKETINAQILLDTAHAQAAYGWKQLIPLDNGLRETIGWYLKNIKEQ